SQGQSLYLDGLLQGTSQPLNHDRYTSTSNSSVMTLPVPLTGTPTEGGRITGSIWEGGYQAYTFEGWLQGGQFSASPNLPYNQVGSAGDNCQPDKCYPTVPPPPYAVTNVAYSASGSMPSLVLTVPGSAPANALTVNAAYATATSAYALAPNTAGVS